MKRKTAVLYLIALILLAGIAAVSGYYAKGDWLKGQLSQVMPSLNGSPPAQTQLTKNKVSRAGKINAAAGTPSAPESDADCKPDAETGRPAISCLYAIPSNWKPADCDIKFIYTLEDSNGSNEINAQIRDRAGKTFYRFPPRRGVHSATSSVDIWNGHLEDGTEIPAGDYQYSVSLTENGSAVSNAKVDFTVT